MIQCIAVEVKIRQDGKCYNDQPISKGKNKSTFMTPCTHIETLEATQLCNAPLPQYVKVDNLWYKFIPNPVVGDVPSILKTKTTASWKCNALTELAYSGIYTPEDLQNMRDRIMFPIERFMVLGSFAAQTSGSNSVYAKKSYMGIFTEKIPENVWEKT